MKFFKFLIVALSFTFLYSCDNATEEIYLNADGSGEYKVSSNMIPSMIQMMSMFAAMDTTFKGDSKELEAMIAEKIWENFPTEVDSILPTKEADLEKFKDDPRKLELAERMQNFMQGSKSKGYMNSGVKFKFKNIKELNEYMVMMNDQSEDEGGVTENLSVDVDYGYKKKCFKRACIYNKIENEDEGGMDKMMEMFANSKAKTIIHLPRNVKSVKGAGMKEKTDKLVIFEYDMIDMMSGEANTDFEIKLR